MDGGYEDDFIVDFAKLMIKHKIYDVRDIDENENKLDFQELFKKYDFGVNANEYSFHVPFDLVDDLRSHIKSGVTLVGAW